ncbi:MAG: ABC transporter ATP-binding protein [Eubacteriales bacterium]
MKRVFAYLKPYRCQCVLAPLFKLLEAGFELIVPLVVAAIIDTGIENKDPVYVVKMCGILLLLAAVGFGAAVFAQYFASVAAVGFGAGVRRALFAKIQSLSYRELDSLGTATMMTRLTSDVNQAQTGVNLTLRLLMRSPFVVFGALIMAATIDGKLSLIFAAVIVLLFAVIYLIMFRTVPLYRKSQEKLDRVLGLTRETLTGARVIRAFCREDKERDLFDDANNTLTRSQTYVGRISALTTPLTGVLINIATLLLIYTGAIRVDAGSLTQGQVVALVNYMAQILVELVKLANLIVTVTKSVASGKRIGGVLAMESSLAVPAVSATPDLGAPAIEMRGVSFTYAGAAAPALSDLDFSLAPGATLGIIGGTGSGKTTLVDLIPRFYDATEGEVRVCGVPVKDYDPDILRSMIGVVPQRALLFAGTIRENLLWGNPGATDEDLIAALRTAQALDVVESKALGLDEPVEAGGKNFSGGQRQRLTIARALVARPNILILDDSASALDYATDARLRHALREDLAGMTVVVVSQRASSVRHADLILVLDDGKVVGMGTHDELRATCPVYEEICASQERGQGA